MDWAIIYGQKEIVRLFMNIEDLLSLPQIKNQDGYTPLHLAVDQDQKEIVELLLEIAPELATDPKLIKTTEGYTLLDFTRGNRENKELFDILVKFNPHLLDDSQDN